MFMRNQQIQKLFQEYIYDKHKNPKKESLLKKNDIFISSNIDKTTKFTSQNSLTKMS